MALADPPTLISAAPTVRIAEQAMPAISNNIRSLRVTEQIGGLSTLELTLFDNLPAENGTAGWGATATSPLQLGAAIKIFCGATTNPREVFDGNITALEGEYDGSQSPLFTVLAEDRLWKARRKRQSRTFENKSPADLVRQVAGDHGLTPEVRELDSPVSNWVQMNESDLGFLRRILARFDGDLQCVDDKLQAGPRASQARTSVTLTLGNELTRARITADVADQATSVRTAGYDSKQGQPVSETATSGQMGPGAGTDGASVLRAKFAEVVENVGDQDAIDSSEGQAMAKALYGQRARRFVRIDAAGPGNPEIRVGSKVSIAGVNPFFVNDYSVTQAVHRYDLAAGYITEFLAESAYLGAGA